MFEIDNVRVAMESAKPYEVADRISDCYFELIELATRPQITDRIRASFGRRRQFLSEWHDDIIRVLKFDEGLADEGSVADAYTSVLSQVDSMMQIEHTRV